MKSTNTRKQATSISIVLLLVLLQNLIAPSVFAQKVDASLEQSIADKQREIEAIKKKTKELEAQIRAAEKAQNTYANSLSILENKTKRTQLEIEETETSLAEAQLELQKLDQTRARTEQEIAKQKRTISAVLQKLHETEETQPVLFLFQKRTLGEFFEQWQYLRSLQDALKQALQRLEAQKQQLESQQRQATERREHIVAIRGNLESAKSKLEQQQNATTSLLVATNASEARYRELLQGIKEEQQYTSSELFRLQDKLRSRLAQRGTVIGTGFVWPVSHPRITTLFHDTTYPFRRLFEHSGLDMAIPAGTGVRATAPGYVVTARSGSTGYGNYVMIVHADGLASLYAHLSKILVSPDQFVEQGSLIGRSGGIPGTPGAGLSTGAHLHFEIREQGIPVDPYRYLTNQ